jgi:uroporphyrinogen-III decarboxylase
MLDGIKIQSDSWVASAKKNLTALYTGQPLERMPFEFHAYRDIKGKTDDNKARQAAATTTVEEYRRNFYNHEVALKNQLQRYNNLTAEEFVDDTVYSIVPLSGSMGWFSEFFGGENEWFPNRPPYPHHVVSEGSQLDSLKPDIASGEMFRTGLEQMRYFAKEVGEAIPVRALDLQSPIDLASILMDYTNLIYLMMDEPAKVHAFMLMITETLIESLHLMKKEMITDWPLSMLDWWMPSGVFMADDLMAIMSPALYAEFGKPYNEMVGREFGGVSLHSCGNIQHNMENVATTEGIIALNTNECLQTGSEILKDRATIITGGVKEVLAANYPGNRRDELDTGDEVETLWWEDFERYPEITGQRSLYQCSALLKHRTAEEAYEKMLAWSKTAIAPDS